MGQCSVQRYFSGALDGAVGNIHQLVQLLYKETLAHSGFTCKCPTSNGRNLTVWRSNREFKICFCRVLACSLFLGYGKTILPCNKTRSVQAQKNICSVQVFTCWLKLILRLLILHPLLLLKVLKEIYTCMRYTCMYAFNSMHTLCTTHYLNKWASCQTWYMYPKHSFKNLELNIQNAQLGIKKQA